MQPHAQPAVPACSKQREAPAADARRHCSCALCLLSSHSTPTGMRHAMLPPCSPGSYSKGELSFQKSRCTLCDQGAVQPRRGQSKCNTCKNGEWQDREGQTVCKICRQAPGLLCHAITAVCSAPFCTLRCFLTHQQARAQLTRCRCSQRCRCARCLRVQGGHLHQRAV